MKPAHVHKQLLLATLDLQRQEIGRECGKLRDAARDFSRAAQSRVRTAGTWAAALSAFWTLRTVTRRSPDSQPAAGKSGRGILAWGRSLLSLAVAVRPLLALFLSPRPTSGTDRTPPRAGSFRGGGI